MNHQYFFTRANEPANRIQFATTPPHLAGAGDFRHITQALRAAGWKNHSAPDYPHVILASPDYASSLVLEPGARSDALAWRLRGHTDGRSWRAAFDGNLPVEILAGFTDALLHPAPSEPPETWTLLTQAGWTYERDDQGSEQSVHPDGTVRVLRYADTDLRPWQAEATNPHGLGGRHIWRAYIDQATPPHLTTGFLTALATDRPLQRGMGDVPHTHLVTQERTGPQAEQLIAAHRQRLADARNAARRIRRATAPETQLHTGSAQPRSAAPPARFATPGTHPTRKIQ
ncbi:DUF317 domain-containing protein [Streptomyces paromomycinus]|uniref:DUF317 domain-containing protein n=1 Tax=Streptomyces paromomycinus TaxID=92743 RepID=A0A401VXR6_STREY|nr:DUF317 domain-containing protein [Streptomyces paromomycinus]GCD41874.1 hypothetical protein GKJPGBOP_01531 [Streptomyces paromomycinus]